MLVCPPKKKTKTKTQNKTKKEKKKITLTWPVNDIHCICCVCKNADCLLRFPGTVTGRSDLFCAAERNLLADVSCSISVFSCHTCHCTCMSSGVVQHTKIRSTHFPPLLQLSIKIDSDLCEYFNKYRLDTKRELSRQRLWDTEELVRMSFVLHIRETWRPVYLRIFVFFDTIYVYVLAKCIPLLSHFWGYRQCMWKIVVQCANIR